MSLEKEFYPPKNWQDFELLCLKIWEQLWEIPSELDFNSTNSQGQNGVDLVGMPKHENAYCGIQCKNRVLHYRYGEANKLRKSDLIKEIEKAKKFKPKLDKLVIATSLYRDKEIEEYIREKSLENVKKGLFRIQICFWDYISRNIQEIDSVAEWYLNRENKKSKYSINVSFDTMEQTIYHPPKFINLKIIYRKQTDLEKKEEESYFRGLNEAFYQTIKNKNIFTKIYFKLFESLRMKKTGKNEIKVEVQINGEKSPRYPREKMILENESNSLKPNEFIGLKTYVDDEQVLKFKIRLENDGFEVIEDYKIEFEMIGNYKKFEVITPTISESFSTKINWGTYFDKGQGVIEPVEKILVQKDVFYSKYLLLTPNMDKNEIIQLSWKFISRDFNMEGILNIAITPIYEEKEKIMYVEFEEESRIEYEYLAHKKEAHYRLNY